MDIGYPSHCGQWLWPSMLIEVVTLRADDRREAEDTSVLQKWWCDVVNTAFRWPTHRYIKHRGYRSPDDCSLSVAIQQLVPCQSLQTKLFETIQTRWDSSLPRRSRTQNQRKSFTEGPVTDTAAAFNLHVWLDRHCEKKEDQGEDLVCIWRCGNKNRWWLGYELRREWGAWWAIRGAQISSLKSLTQRRVTTSYGSSITLIHWLW